MMKRNAEKVSNCIQVIYAGIRIDSQHKRYFSYYFLKDNKQGGYDKKLLGYENIGAIIEVEKTETGVRGPYTPIGRLEPSSDIYKHIPLWTTEDRIAKELYQTILLVKKGCEDKTLDSLIGQICQTTSFLSLKKKIRLARYVFEKIIGFH